MRPVMVLRDESHRTEYASDPHAPRPLRGVSGGGHLHEMSTHTGRPAVSVVCRVSSGGQGAGRGPVPTPACGRAVYQLLPTIGGPGGLSGVRLEDEHVEADPASRGRAAAPSGATVDHQQGPTTTPSARARDARRWLCAPQGLDCPAVPRARNCAPTWTGRMTIVDLVALFLRTRRR